MYTLKKYLASRSIRKSLSERGLPLDDLERKHINKEEALFNDSSYFLGRGDDGSYMVVRQAFRTTRGNEYWLNIHIPGKGTFVLKNMESNEGEGFKLGNLSFICIEPGKTWEINYKGPITKDTEEVDIDLKLTFTGTRELINFKNITNPRVTGSVIAKEKWSKSFLNDLKEIKKVHLEQGGYITGMISIDGVKTEINWRSIRDHSWGNRTWKGWKRHIWLSGVLDNGEVFNISIIKYNFLGQLAAGYITSKDKVTYIHEVPQMESFAGTPLIANPGKFKFLYADNKTHEIKIKISGYFDFMMDDEYFIHEGMGDFELDGIKGKGVAEFGLNPVHYDIKAQ